MVSRVARHLLGTLGGIVALAAVPSVGFPQSEPVRTDEAERIAEDIRAAVQTDGPQSAALIGPLSELAVLYEAEGEHALATAALEEARHVVRANYGLHTLDQAPLMQQALRISRRLATSRWYGRSRRSCSIWRTGIPTTYERWRSIATSARGG